MEMAFFVGPHFHFKDRIYTFITFKIKREMICSNGKDFMLCNWWAWLWWWWGKFAAESSLPPVWSEIWDIWFWHFMKFDLGFHDGLIRVVAIQRVNWVFYCCVYSFVDNIKILMICDYNWKIRLKKYYYLLNNRRKYIHLHICVQVTSKVLLTRSLFWTFLDEDSFLGLIIQWD